MLIGRALAVGAVASRALVVGTPLPAEVGACGQIVVRTVEALASKRGGRRLRVAEVGVTIAISRIREPHHRDREQPRHDDLSHRFFPLCTKPPSRAQESFESINPLPYPQTKPRHRRASKVEGAEISAFVVTQITYFERDFSSQGAAFCGGDAVGAEDFGAVVVFARGSQQCFGVAQDSELRADVIYLPLDFVAAAFDVRREGLRG